jgi:hypothetical protein
MEYKLNENYGIFDLSIKDFTCIDKKIINEFDQEEYKIFDLNKDCIIFNKPYDAIEREKKGAIEVQIHKNVNIIDCISTINKYIKWLNSDDCKKELIDKFCEFVNSYSYRIVTIEDIIHNKWYEKLELNGVIITIPNDYEKMNFCIICIDQWHILYIEMEENKIMSINDEYVNPENDVGYNGVWDQ